MTVHDLARLSESSENHVAVTERKLTGIGLPWKPDYRRHPGSMHRQSTWRERALDFRQPLPLWIRVAFMAYAHHVCNGHATFGKGDLLRKIDAAALKAAKKPPGERQMYRAIADAIAYGYLDRRSSLRCLIVPAAAVYGGVGHVNDACAYCEGKKAVRRW